MLTNYLDWYKLNLMALTNTGYFPSKDITFIEQDKPVLVIDNFRLPENFKQKFTKLMIVFPYRHNIFSARPDQFYLDKNLKLRKGKNPGHIYNNSGFNDLSDRGWARYSFHLKKWCPKHDVISGTSIYDILEAIYEGLKKL